MKRQYAVPIYVQFFFEDLLDSEIQFTVNDQLYLDTLFIELRAKTIFLVATWKRKKCLEEKKMNLGNGPN